ncbi:transcriptional regulator, MerR family [Pseudomonas sp. R4-34-07]|nr:transcriptional regulator, MerR family [Pseudomonas sp. R4-34-07]
MHIGKAAQVSGTTIKAFRHYEVIRLMPEPQRQGGHRVYTAKSFESQRMGVWLNAFESC